MTEDNTKMHEFLYKKCDSDIRYEWMDKPGFTLPKVSKIPDELQMRASAMKPHINANDIEYLYNHPELQWIIDYYVFNVLHYRPKNVVAFVSDLFRDPDIRRKVYKRMYLQKCEKDNSKHEGNMDIDGDRNLLVVKDETFTKVTSPFSSRFCINKSPKLICNSASSELSSSLEYLSANPSQVSVGSSQNDKKKAEHGNNITETKFVSNPTIRVTTARDEDKDTWLKIPPSSRRKTHGHQTRPKADTKSTNIDRTQMSPNIDGTQMSINIDRTQIGTNIDTTQMSTHIDTTQMSTNIDTTQMSTNFDKTQMSTNIDATQMIGSGITRHIPAINVSSEEESLLKELESLSNKVSLSSADQIKFPSEIFMPIGDGFIERKHNVNIKHRSITDWRKTIRYKKTDSFLDIMSDHNFDQVHNSYDVSYEQTKVQLRRSSISESSESLIKSSTSSTTSSLGSCSLEDEKNDNEETNVDCREHEIMCTGQMCRQNLIDSVKNEYSKDDSVSSLLVCDVFDEEEMRPRSRRTINVCLKFA